MARAEQEGSPGVFEATHVPVARHLLPARARDGYPDTLRQIVARPARHMSSRLISPAGDSGSGGPRRRRRPLNPRTAFRIAVLGGVTMVVIGVLLIRLWFMQVIDAQGYAAVAVANSIRTVVVPAPRGLITDRTGKTILADNIPSVNVVAFPLELRGARRATEMAMLAPILHTGADQLMAAMVSGQAASPYLPVVLGQNISVIQQAAFSEHVRQFPGVALQNAYLRNYPLGTLAAHILGYTGTIPPGIRKLCRPGLPRQRAGGPSRDRGQYEQYLRGVPGQTQVEVDASGNPVSAGPVSSTPPVQGDNLALSIDMATQTALESQLRQRVRSSRTATGAAGVAIDPNTGQILAMASYPTYSPNAFGQRTPANNKLVSSYLTNPGIVPIASKSDMAHCLQVAHCLFSWRRIRRTRANAAKSLSVVRIDIDRREATAQIRKSMWLPWIPRARQRLKNAAAVS